MMEFSDSLLDSRELRLVPTVWWQTLLSADSQHPPHEVRRLGFQAKANWFEGWNWLGDRARSDMIFNIDILSEATASKRREEEEGSPEWKGTIGGLRYQDEWQNSEIGVKQEAYVVGIFSVSDTVFEDLWERVKFRVALPCSIDLRMLGLQTDTPYDFWDVKGQPKLKVLSVEIRFTTECHDSLLTKSGPSDP